MRKIKLLTYLSVIPFFLYLVGINAEGRSLKIGYVDVEEVFQSYPKVEKLQELLQIEMGSINQELAEIREKIDALSEELKKPLSAEVKAEKESLLQNYQNSFQEKTKEAQEILRKKEVEMTQNLHQDIYDAVAIIAEKNNLDLVLSSDVVIWIKEKNDITEEVIELLEQRYEEELKEEKKE